MKSLKERFSNKIIGLTLGASLLLPLAADKLTADQKSAVAPGAGNPGVTAAGQMLSQTVGMSVAHAANGMEADIQTLKGDVGMRIYGRLSSENQALLQRYYDAGKAENNPNFLKGFDGAFSFVKSLQTIQSTIANPSDPKPVAMVIEAAEMAKAGAPNSWSSTLPQLAKAQELNDANASLLNNALAQTQNRLAQAQADVALLERLVAATSKWPGMIASRGF